MAIAILVSIYAVFFAIGLERGADRRGVRAAEPCAVSPARPIRHLSGAPVSPQPHGLSRRPVPSDRRGVALCGLRRILVGHDDLVPSASLIRSRNRSSSASRCATPITATCKAVSKAPAGLFARGVLMWFLAVVPFVVGVVAATLMAVDWSTLAAADDIMSWLETSGLGGAVVYAGLTCLWLLLSFAILYPVVGLPLIATRLAPLIPYSLERKFGTAMERQTRASLDTRHAGAAFECGNAGTEKQGRAAFDKLMGQLETAATLPIPLKAVVVRRPEANAIALPGGHIYVFQGLVIKPRPRRTRRRHRARDRPCRASRRDALAARNRRIVVFVRHAAR